MRHATMLCGLVVILGLVAGCEAEAPIEAGSAPAAEVDHSDELPDDSVLPRVPRRRSASDEGMGSPGEAEQVQAQPEEASTAGSSPTADEQDAAQALADALAQAAKRQPGDPPTDDGELLELLDQARSIVTRDGEEALLHARSPQPRSAPSDADLRGWVEEFAETREAHRAWALAQLIRFEDHHHYGRFWTHDEPSWNGVVEIAKGHSDPLRRWLAIDALGEHGGVAKDALLSDADPRVRAVAARHLPAPDHAPLSEAQEITEALTELAGSPDPRVRAMAVVGLAKWSHTAVHRDLVKRMALSDDDAHARAGAIRALPSLGLEHAVEVLQQYRRRSPLTEVEREALREVRNWLPIRVVDER